MVIEFDLLTPTQQRMLKVLGDGLPHHRNELHECLVDELASPKAVVKHLSIMRKLLRMKGLDVVPRSYGRRVKFQLVRLYIPEE